VEWRRAEAQPEKRRRVFRTTRWVMDQPLSRFPGWERRLDSAVGRVFDIVGEGFPTGGFDSRHDELPAEVQAQLAAQQVEADPVVELDGHDEQVFLSFVWRVRDRLGGDINVTVDDGQTMLFAIATVRPI